MPPIRKQHRPFHSVHKPYGDLDVPEKDNSLYLIGFLAVGLSAFAVGIGTALLLLWLW